MSFIRLSVACKIALSVRDSSYFSHLTCKIGPFARDSSNILSVLPIREPSSLISVVASNLLAPCPVAH